MVSVIIPTYNRAPLVQRAIASALRETRPGDEVIVIDDGSTDNTRQALATYGTSIRYIRTQNQGAGKARNLGIHEARNPLVAFLDSDDEWMPGKLALQRTLMSTRPDILFCFTNLSSNHNGKRVARALRYWHDDPRDWDDILSPGALFSSIAAVPEGCTDCTVYTGNLYHWEMAANCIFTSTLMVSKTHAGEALHFAEDLATYEDWECYGRLAKQGRAAYIDCDTAVQHCHAGPRLTDADTLRACLARLTLLERVWGTDPVYLTTHNGDYQRVLAELRIRKIKGLIAAARTTEARQEMRGMIGLPLSYRLLAFLPGFVTRRLVATYHRLQYTLSAS